jgi:hypothetical protein
MFKTELQKKVKNRLFVTPKVGLNFSGVLVKADRTEQGWATFTDAKLHLPNANPEPVHDTIIQNSNIAYLQILPPVEEKPVVNNVTYLTKFQDDADD